MDEPPAGPPELSIVVPTYREAENLPLLVPRIASALRDAGLSHEILVVDDASPDATLDVCARLADEYPVRLVVRSGERGLAGAVLFGMNQARGEILVVMDADLSHPPEKIPELAAAVRDGADFVLGSRYVPGGGTDDAWGVWRWINSKAATLLARPITAVRDPMAGFFAMKRSRFLAADRLDPIGYKIGLELLVKCDCRDVREVPIHFRAREHGESKLDLKEQVNYLRHLARLYRYLLVRRMRRR